MKKHILAMSLAGALSISGVVFAADNSLYGKIIALDAGHGGTETGAVNVTYDPARPVYEKDVNLAVVYALMEKLNAAGAHAALTRVGDETLSSRKERVDIALEKCAAVDANIDGIADNKKCDALVSVHHNGSGDPTHDGTMAIYNEKKDKPLAEKLLVALTPLTGKSEGLENGGYGMTVYGNLVSVITEAYYVTNDAKASSYLNDLNAQGVSNLVIEEADAQMKGLFDYFTFQTSGGGGRPRK